MFVVLIVVVVQLLEGQHVHPRIRALPYANILANADLDTLISKGTRKRC